MPSAAFVGTCLNSEAGSGERTSLVLDAIFLLGVQRHRRALLKRQRMRDPCFHDVAEMRRYAAITSNFLFFTKTPAAAR